MATYQVKPGETLPQAAARLGIPIYRLAQMNGTNTVSTGDRLTVPTSKTVTNKITSASGSRGGASGINSASVPRMDQGWRTNPNAPVTSPRQYNGPVLNSQGQYIGAYPGEMGHPGSGVSYGSNVSTPRPSGANPDFRAPPRTPDHPINPAQILPGLDYDLGAEIGVPGSKGAPGQVQRPGLPDVSRTANAVIGRQIANAVVVDPTTGQVTVADPAFLPPTISLINAQTLFLSSGGNLSDIDEYFASLGYVYDPKRSLYVLKPVSSPPAGGGVGEYIIPGAGPRPGPRPSSGWSANDSMLLRAATG